MERSNNKVKDIVVIGAGVGGLATSIRLAKKGHKVSIYEAGNFIGGKCHSIVREGFTFDTGPNLLTIPAVYRDLFMKSGKRLEHILELKSVDPAFAYNFSDGKVLKLSNLSVKNNCDEIESVFGKGAGDEWHNLMQRAERMWDLSRGPFIESELRIKNILKELSFSKLIAISPFISLRKYVSRYTKNKYLRMIIDRYATYSGSDPRKAPAPILTIPFIESAFGAWHITGGIGKLSEKLGERAQEIGVRIQLNSPVEKIILKDGRAAGIKLKSGEEIISDLVVSNVDATLLYENLIPTNFKGARRERRKLNNLTPSFSGFSLFIGLDNSKISGPVPKLEHHNIYFPDDYDESLSFVAITCNNIKKSRKVLCNLKNKTKNKIMLAPVIQKNDKQAKLLIGIFSVVVFVAVSFLSKFTINVQLPFDKHIFALLNALLNTAVAILLVLALLAIKQKKYTAHKNLMLTALILSVLFLVSYIAHHLLAGETKFGDTDHDGIVSVAEIAVVGNLRAFYFILLDLKSTRLNSSH